MENSTDKPTIDEQLAEANRQFDARLAAEKKPAKQAVVAAGKPKRNSRPIVRPRVGAVAHQHERIRDDEAFDQDCPYVEHNVRDRKGFMINDTRYRGKVIVPQCVANTLAEMENKHRMMERGVFEDRGRKVSLGEFRG